MPEDNGWDFGTAAETLLDKLNKYKKLMTNNTASIALFLDPRRSSNEVHSSIKIMVRAILISDYGFVVAEEPDDRGKEFNLFAVTTQSDDVCNDEVEDFCLLTLKADKLCKCPVIWWKQQARRFPKLSLLARDTLIIMGSSVASESAFSDSGDLISADRALLSDDNICNQMKLRSWNRLFGIFD